MVEQKLQYGGCLFYGWWSFQLLILKGCMLWKSRNLHHLCFSHSKVMRKPFISCKGKGLFHHTCLWMMVWWEGAPLISERCSHLCSSTTVAELALGGLGSRMDDPSICFVRAPAAKPVITTAGWIVAVQARCGARLHAVPGHTSAVTCWCITANCFWDVPIFGQLEGGVGGPSES